MCIFISYGEHRFVFVCTCVDGLVGGGGGGGRG